MGFLKAVLSFLGSLESCSKSARYYKSMTSWLLKIVLNYFLMIVDYDKTQIMVFLVSFLSYSKKSKWWALFGRGVPYDFSLFLQ